VSVEELATRKNVCRCDRVRQNRVTASTVVPVNNDSTGGIFHVTAGVNATRKSWSEV
jgi:hypothetical protein